MISPRSDTLMLAYSSLQSMVSRVIWSSTSLKEEKPLLFKKMPVALVLTCLGFSRYANGFLNNYGETSFGIILEIENINKVFC